MSSGTDNGFRYLHGINACIAECTHARVVIQTRVYAVDPDSVDAQLL